MIVVKKSFFSFWQTEQSAITGYQEEGPPQYQADGGMFSLFNFYCMSLLFFVRLVWEVRVFLEK